MHQPRYQPRPDSRPEGCSPVPDIPYLRRLMADALDKGEPVLMFPPGSEKVLREELEIEPEEFSEQGVIQVAIDEADELGPTALLIHFGPGEHLASDLITGNRTLSEAEGGFS